MSCIEARAFVKCNNKLITSPSSANIHRPVVGNLHYHPTRKYRDGNIIICGYSKHHIESARHFLRMHFIFNERAILESLVLSCIRMMVICNQPTFFARLGKMRIIVNSFASALQSQNLSYQCSPLEININNQQASNLLARR